jgi:microcystin-dependent protein
MSEPFIGEIFMAGFNFPPVGWASCNGSLVPISQYDALFALIGTTYGGDGVNTFALPNLQSRVPIHNGQGPGLPTNFVLGQTGGLENVTLSLGNVPAHSHSVQVSDNAGTSSTPANTLTLGSGAEAELYTPEAADVNSAMTVGGGAGGNTPHSNIMPFLAVNFFIALEGIFPSQN